MKFSNPIHQGLMILLVIVLGLLAACTPAAPVETPVLPDTAVLYSPIPEEQCNAIRDQVAATLGVQAEATEAPFVDFITAETGTGCRITATGTGAHFPDFVTVSNQLREMLQALGWEEDQQYVADAPTQTAFAMRQDGALAMVNAGWQPGPEVQCPQDQPISECQVSPEQQVYTITLDFAQREPAQ